MEVISKIGDLPIKIKVFVQVLVHQFPNGWRRKCQGFLLKSMKNEVLLGRGQPAYVKTERFFSRN